MSFISICRLELHRKRLFFGSEERFDEMLSLLFCGSFQSEEETVSKSPSSSPRSWWRKRRSKGKKNPFSSLGLDKFRSLVADLEEKRSEVYSQMGSDIDPEKMLVRFVYSTPEKEAVPIVVKVKDVAQESSSSGELLSEKSREHRRCLINKKKGVAKQPEEAKKTTPVAKAKPTKIENKTKKDELPWKWLVKNLKRPSLYVPVVLILILVFLALFGRTAAILCTSIGWYILPNLSSKDLLQSTKKQYIRAFSDTRTLNTRSSPPPSPINYSRNSF